MPLDNSKNFSKAATSIGHTAAQTNITLNAGQGANLPDPAVREYNSTWHNVTDFPDPSDDPNVEIIRVKTKSGDTLPVIVRAQEGTIATDKNIPFKTYQFSVLPTSKLRIDIEQEIQNSLMSKGGTTGTGTAYDLTLDPAPLLLLQGMMIRVQFNVTNTNSTPTLNVNGTGNKTIRDQTGIQIPAGFLQALSTHLMVLDGIQWRIIAIPMSTSDLINNIWDHATEDGTSTGLAYFLNYDRSPNASFDNTEGALVTFKAVNASVAGATLKVEASDTPAAILKNGGVAIEANDIQIGDSVIIQKNVASGVWYLMSAGVLPKFGNANFVSATDDVPRSVATINVFQDLPFSFNDEIDGWTHSVGPATADFVAPAVAKYEVTLDVVVQKTSGANSTMEFIGVLDGTEVTRSQLPILLTSNNNPAPASRTFIIDVTTVGDIFKIQFTATTTLAQLITMGANAADAVSAALTITRI